ncbi:Transcription repressor OFP3 [Striga hermonthica]|uniref:Transcription repressor n=1 Tax=Striga hermonthica TaxID=68872 RepID=A0A9N7N264_STRHE|nr:Transcription repressor OFP3 [Striga hermonthica]
MTKKLQKVSSSSCKAFCCGVCRLSVSSQESEISEKNSEKFHGISRIAHAMVQERLDQMIREREEERKRERTVGRSRRENIATKFVVMVAMERTSFDPREDFRESMVEMIVSSKIHEAKDLRRLLNYYLEMNSEESRGIILEVFHEVCTDLFVYDNRH